MDNNKAIVQVLRDTVSNWFYNVACVGYTYKSQDELIDNIYLWMNSKNIEGTRKCCCDCLNNIFSDKFIDEHYKDIVDELMDCAEDAWYNLYKNDKLPEKYACTNNLHSEK